MTDTIDVGESQNVRPLLGRTWRQGQWRPCSQGSFASAAAASLEAFVAIEPFQLLVVHPFSRAPEQDQRAPMDGCELPQPGVQHGIIRRMLRYRIEVLSASIT